MEIKINVLTSVLFCLPQPTGASAYGLAEAGTTGAAGSGFQAPPCPGDGSVEAIGSRTGLRRVASCTDGVPGHLSGSLRSRPPTE